MNIRQQKKTLWAAAAVLAGCAVCVVALAVLTPVKVEVASATNSPRGRDLPHAGDDANAASANRPAASGPEFLSQLQRLCAADLRRPLQDPPPAPGSRGPRGRPGAGSVGAVKLIGTADEPGHSMAVFLAPGGAIEVCGEGQSFKLSGGGEVTVVAVDPNKVAVQIDGRRHELVMPPKP